MRNMIQENLLSCSKKNIHIMSFKTNQFRAYQLETCQFAHVINKVCMITSIRFVASNPSINLLMNTKIELWVYLDGSHKCAMTINLIDYQCVSNKLHHKRWRSIVDWYHSFRNYYKNNDVHDSIHGLSNIIPQMFVWTIFDLKEL